MGHFYAPLNVVFWVEAARRAAPISGLSFSGYDAPMSGTFSLMAHVAGAVLVGTMIDWGIIEKVKMTIGPYGDEHEMRYRDLPCWRVICVLVASAVAGGSLTDQGPLLFPFLAGILTFTGLNLYGNYLALKERTSAAPPRRNVR